MNLDRSEIKNCFRGVALQADVAGIEAATFAGQYVGDGCWIIVRNFGKD